MNDIRKIFQHCEQVRIMDDGRILPLRFSDERLGFYAQQPRTPYSQCATGVTAEFYTDAKEISFEYKFTPPQFDYITADFFDILENDKYVKTLSPSMYTGKITYKLRNSGKTKVCIYLPVGVNTEFKNFELGNWEPVTQPKEKMLVLGDSISQGLFGQNPYLAPIPQLARKAKVDYLNASVGGEIFRKDSIDPHLSFTPDIILIELGSNDMGFVREMDKISKNIDEFFEVLMNKYPKARKAAVTPFWFTDYGTSKEADEREALSFKIRDKVFAVCKELNIPAFSGLDLFPHDPELYSDICHPNNEGFTLLVDNLYEKLKQHNIL